MKSRIALHILFWGTYLFLRTYMDVFLINYSYFKLPWDERIAKALLPEMILLIPKILMAYFLMYYVIPDMGKSQNGNWLPLPLQSCSYHYYFTIPCFRK